MSKKYNLKGGSYAKTILIKEKKNFFVRKEVPNSIDKLRGETVLKGQFDWLNYAYNLNLNVPKVFQFKKNSKKTFYDMEYIKNSKLFSSYRNKGIEYEEIFSKILKNIYKFHLTNIEKKRQNKQLLKELINKKVFPSIKFLEKNKNFKKILFKKKIKINNKFYENSKNLLNIFLKPKNNKLKNLLKNFDSQYKTIIHGDLTFENILVKNNNFFYIDPLGSFMDPKFDGDFLKKASIYFDLAKLCQSILTNFEVWKNYKNFNFKLEKNKSLDINFEISKFLGKTNDKKFLLIVNRYKFLNKNIKDLLLIHLSIIMLRIIRYKVKENFNAAVMCYLMGTYWLNQVKI